VSPDASASGALHALLPTSNVDSRDARDPRVTRKTREAGDSKMGVGDLTGFDVADNSAESERVADLEDLGRALNQFDRAIRTGLISVLFLAILFVFLPFFIVDLVFAGIPPPAIFNTGIAGGQISAVIMLFLLGSTSVAVRSGATAERTLDWSLPSRHGERSNVGRVAALGYITVLFGVCSFGAVIASGLASQNTPLYWQVLRAASDITLVTLILVGILLVEGISGVTRLLENAPDANKLVLTRDARLVGWTSWFALAFGLVFFFGTTIRYPTWVEGWPIFLGVITPIGATVALWDAKNSVARWRSSVKAQLQTPDRTPDDGGVARSRRYDSSGELGGIDQSISADSTPLVHYPVDIDLAADMQLEWAANLSTTGFSLGAGCFGALFLDFMGGLSFFGVLGGTSTIGAFLVVMSVVFWILFAWGYRQLRLSVVSRIHIDAQSIAFVRKNGPPLAINWSDTQLKIDVNELSGRADKVLPKRDPRRTRNVWVDVWQPPSRRLQLETTLPPDAASVIVAAARSQGVRSSSVRVCFWWHPVPRGPGFLDHSEDGDLRGRQSLNGRVVKLRGSAQLARRTD
jgi:hypothetical protein